MKQLMMCLFFFVTSFSTLLSSRPNLILIGPPGSGKGTFSSFMTAKYHYTHICPGDLFRSHIKQDTELGKKIKPIVEKGEYIADDIVFSIMKGQIIDCLEKKQTFILDGFPRSVAGFEFLNRLFEEKGIKDTINYVHFNIDDQVCLERITTRLVCLKCFSIYNNGTKKPITAMICDTCQSPLEVRLGDTVENTVKRLTYFRKNVEPLAVLAKQYFKIIEINAAAQLSNCLNFYNNLNFDLEFQ